MRCSSGLAWPLVSGFALCQAELSVLTPPPPPPFWPFPAVKLYTEHLLLLRSITRDAKTSEPRAILNKDLENSLMWALTGQRSAFTKMLCPIVDIASMLQRDDCRSLDRIFNASNSAGARDYLAVLYESAAKTTVVRSSDTGGRLGGYWWCTHRKEVTHAPSFPIPVICAGLQPRTALDRSTALMLFVGG